MKRLLIGALWLFASLVGMRAVEVKVTSPEETLATTKYFSFGGIGYVGSISDSEKALALICERPDAVQVLRAVFKRATTEGRCYILVGLQKLAPDDYQTHFKAMQAFSLPVFTLQGCLGQSQSSERILKIIHSGFYQTYLHNKEKAELESAAYRPELDFSRGL